MSSKNPSRALPSLFILDGDALNPTEYVRGPWDPGLLHGGAVCGALGWAADQALKATENSDEFRLCRLTTEIMRPVPVAPLRHESTVDHHGKRSRVISASLWHGDKMVARSSSQWVRTRLPADPVAVGETVTDSAVPLRPVAVTDPGSADLDYPRPGFNCDVFEFRCLDGDTETPGPGVAWVRLKAALVAGQSWEPVHLLAAASDLGNALGWEPSPNGEPMVNPDVTLQLFRYPIGEWICLQSQARSTTAGIGMTDTILWDGNGQFGRTMSTTMESTMPLTAGLPIA